MNEPKREAARVRQVSAAAGSLPLESPSVTDLPPRDSSRESPPKSAAERVFAIVELAEFILLESPPRAVLRNQRVSKVWQATVLGSKALQQALFFEPVIAGFKETSIHYPYLRQITSSDVYSNESDPSASWRRQLLNQPPVLDCKLRVECEQTQTCRYHLNDSPGVRLGAVNDTIRRRSISHRRCGCLSIRKWHTSEAYLGEWSWWTFGEKPAREWLAAMKRDI
ncbi:hypothetical protein CLAFUW4_09933 [Fulvia fulva]|nr:hypothetical protein CLAFUR4_09937 [Fulvia fulva]WPV19538.1 hypothetical protein CLAFUW4_09933 [Fulvia fulva]WPV34015.1 hypothetical protein CLAFUW7_09934 [Fulvia fulva]